MSNFLIQSGTLFEDFENIGDWTVTAGSASQNDILFKTGTKSVGVTTAVGSTGTITKTISQSFSTTGNIGYWVYITDVTTLVSIQFIISSDATFTKFFKKSLFTSTDNFHDGWNYITVPKSAWTNTGSDDWANTMIRVRFIVTAQTNMTSVVFFDSIYINRRSRSKVIFSFDDSFASAYTNGKSYMDKYRLRGTMYVISGKIGTSSYMTKDQLQDMYDKGWDLCNHTDTHTHLPTLSDQAAIEDQITTCRQFLLNNGWTRNEGYRHFCYPFGEYDAKTLAAVQNQNCLSARGTKTWTQSSEFDNPYLLNITTSGASTVNYATVQAGVDQAIQEGTTAMMLFHEIVTSPSTSTQWATSDFQTLVDYIISKKELIDVITMTEWYKGLQAGGGRKLVNFNPVS